MVHIIKRARMLYFHYALVLLACVNEVGTARGFRGGSNTACQMCWDVHGRDTKGLFSYLNMLACQGMHGAG